MKRLGVIEVKTKDGLIIVKSDLRDPRKLVGSIVYDKDLRRLGKIVDVIGKTDSPYVVVKPETKEVVDFVEEGPVYYYVERKPFRKRGVKKGVKPSKKKKMKKGRGGPRRNKRKKNKG